MTVTPPSVDVPLPRYGEVSGANAEGGFFMLNLCSIGGCITKTEGRGLCTKHYARWRRHGSPLINKRPELAMSLSERFWRVVDKTESCWLWTGSKDRHGYGRINIDRTPQLAHRISYLMAHGPIPDGLELDHLCRQHSCVRPAHLEPVTHRENMCRSPLVGKWRRKPASER